MHFRRAPVTLLAITALALLLPSGCSKKDSVANPRMGPAAGFSAAPRSGPRPLDVDFTNLSTPGSSAITSVLWDFGDGSTSPAMNPAHSYAAPGTYTVSLTVTTADGSNTQTRDPYISVSNGPGSSPANAAFSGAPAAGNSPLTVAFTDASIPGTTAITGWSWTFGDGGISAAQNPSHTYLANGSYAVGLTVTTVSDGTDTETKPNYVVVSSVPFPPTAQFSGTPLEGVMPLTVQFTDHSSPGSAPITARSWSFGDGGTSTVANPSHTYIVAGTYTVTLTVTTSVGSNSSTQTGYITVHQAADPCPNPIYSVVSTTWSNITDADGDGYRTRGRLTWNTNVGAGCTKSVFARIYARSQGDTTWTLAGTSACYNVLGSKTNNEFSVFLQGLAMSCYDLRVDVFECGGTEVKASRGAADDPHLTAQCFEP